MICKVKGPFHSWKKKKEKRRKQKAFSFSQVSKILGQGKKKTSLTLILYVSLQKYSFYKVVSYIFSCGQGVVFILEWYVDSLFYSMGVLCTFKDKSATALTKQACSVLHFFHLGQNWKALWWRPRMSEFAAPQCFATSQL